MPLGTHCKRISKIDGRKAIVLFTDGVDTTSGKADYDSTSPCRRVGALIFPIYYNTFFDGRGGVNGGINGGMIPVAGQRRRWGLGRGICTR